MTGPRERMSWGERVLRTDQQHTRPLRRGSAEQVRISPGGRVARGFTGSLTAGLVLLALALLAAQLWLSDPGPGVGVVILHLVGAGAAVALQLIADRTQGRAGTLAMLGVLVAAAAVLWFGWLY